MMKSQQTGSSFLYQVRDVAFTSKACQYHSYATDTTNAIHLEYPVYFAPVALHFTFAHLHRDSPDFSGVIVCWATLLWKGFVFMLITLQHAKILFARKMHQEVYAKAFTRPHPLYQLYLVHLS